MQTQTETSSFKRYYLKHRKKLNKARRERYASDPAYRKRQLKASKEWRKKNPGYRREKADTQPKLMTIGTVAEELGTCVQTLRAIEKRGLIPDVREGTGHRKYSESQVELMRPLVEYLQNTHYKTPGYNKEVKRLSALVKKGWKK